MPKWLPKFAPGPLAPEGEWWAKGACSFLYTHFPLKAPSHHIPPPHFPSLSFAAGIFPLFGSAIIFCLCAGWSAVQDTNSSARASASHFGIHFWGFFILFPYRFRQRFFHAFSCFSPPFFQCFFDEFPMQFTSLFWMLFGYVLPTSLLQKIIFFQHPPF